MKIFILWLVLVFNFYFVSAQLNLIRHDPYVIDTVYYNVPGLVYFNSNLNYWYVGENRFINNFYQVDNMQSGYWNKTTNSLALSDSLFNPSFLTDNYDLYLSNGEANCDACYGVCYFSEDYKNKELWVSWSFVQPIKLVQKQMFGFSVSKFDSLGNWQFTTIIDSTNYFNSTTYTSSIQVQPNAELWGVRGGTENSQGNTSFFKVSNTGQVISVISDTLYDYRSINKFEMVTDSTFLVQRDSFLILYNDSLQVLWSKSFGNLFKPYYFSNFYEYSYCSKTERYERFCKRSDGKIWVLTDTLYLLDTDGTTLWKQKHSVNFTQTFPWQNLYINLHLTLLNDSTVLITESSPDGNFSYIKKYTTQGEHWIYPCSKDIKRVQKLNDFQIFSGDKGRYWFTTAPFQISGMLQFDTDLDGQQTAADVPARFKTLKITNLTTQQSWTCASDSFGFYQFWLEAGNYEIYPVFQPSLVTQITVNQNITKDFLLNGTWNDAGISYQQWNQTLTVRNYGTSAWNGTLTANTNWTPFTFNIPPNTVNGLNYIWNLNIPTFGSLDLIQQTNVHFIAELSPDQDLSNNYFQYHIFGFPFDPNQKTVSDTLLWPSEVQNPKWLNYTIDFQNIGTAPAQHVIIDDSLSSFLNADQIEITYASHPVQMLQNGHFLRFFFENIMLPDSNANEPASHGRIEFRIKPLQGLGLGSTISNRAKIYFDSQPAVITNTVQTKVDTVMSIEKNQWMGTKMYPNPAQNQLFFSRTDAKPTICKIYNIHGMLCKEIQIQGNSVEVNISDLVKGLYLIELDKSSFKLMKE